MWTYEVGFFSLKFFMYNAFVAFLQLVNKDISITLFCKKKSVKWRTIGPEPRRDAFKLESSMYHILKKVLSDILVFRVNYAW